MHSCPVTLERGRDSCSDSREALLRLVELSFSFLVWLCPRCRITLGNLDIRIREIIVGICQKLVIAVGGCLVFVSDFEMMYALAKVVPSFAVQPPI